MLISEKNECERYNVKNHVLLWVHHLHFQSLNDSERYPLQSTNPVNERKVAKIIRKLFLIFHESLSLLIKLDLAQESKIYYKDVFQGINEWNYYIWSSLWSFGMVAFPAKIFLALVFP